MKCSKCGAPLRGGMKFCPKCGRKIRHTARNVLLILLVLTLALGGAGVAGWKLGLLPRIRGGLGENITLLSGSFTDRKILDRGSALAAVGDAAAILGIRNAEEELGSCQEATAFDNTYYRFYQEYQGIPVYGRSVIVTADTDGTGLSLSGNYRDVGRVDIKPTVTQREMEDAIRRYFSESLNISAAELDIKALDDQMLCIYDMDNGEEAHLCYSIPVTGAFSGAYELIMDAHTAEVLAAVPELYEVLSYKASDVKKEYGFETVFSDNQYCMIDSTRNLCVFCLNNKESMYDMKDDSGHPITDENGDRYQIEQWGEGEFLISANNVFGDTQEEKEKGYEDGAQLLIHISNIFDVYKSFGFVNEDRIFLYYRDGYDHGNNALGGYIREHLGVISMGTNTGVNCVDVIAHEFTHFVSRKIVQWDGSNEAGSLNEGISDIMGELIEAKLSGNDPDWQMDSYRDIRTPGDGCISNYADYNDELDSHDASTIISHAAYLMWVGDEGGAYMPLSTQDLARLFYSTLFTVPSDCTFSQFSTLLQNTAEIMYKQGALSEKQRDCVKYALSQVGITPSEAVCYTVSNSFFLEVYDVEGSRYDNYDVTASTILAKQGPGLKSPLEKWSKTFTANVPISLKEGRNYQLTITDRADEKNQAVCFVRVQSSGRDRLPVYTTFGTAVNDAFPAYLEAAKATTISGSWTEDLSMTVNMTLVSDKSETKAKGTIGSTMDIDGYREEDQSGLRMSGSANMTIAGQMYAWDMSYANGMAHFDYVEPTIKSADVAIDPSYFNFNSITEDMVSASDLFGNTIHFTVRGDAMTEAGIAAISLMDGMEDLHYGDVYTTVEIDEKTGKIDSLSMAFHASMRYQGYDAEADYSLEYRFWEHGPQNNEYVSDAYRETLESGGVSYSYQIPKINLNYRNVTALNEEIYKKLYSGTDYWDGIQGEMENIRSGETGMYYKISYDWAVNDRILSLIINCDDTWGGTSFDIYNVSIDTGDTVSKDELLQYKAWTEDQYRETVKHALGSYFWDCYGEVIHDDRTQHGEGFLEGAKTQLAKTISAANIDAASPYLDQDGYLCAAGTVYSMAGADSYDHLFNLEEFEMSPYYSEMINLPTKGDSGTQVSTAPDPDGFDTDEPCVYCHHTPTKGYMTANGDLCYVCRSHAMVCSVCGGRNGAVEHHVTNMLGTEIFLCGHCYEGFYSGS